MNRYLEFWRWIVLFFLVPLAVTACGSAKPSEHYFDIDARQGALTPNSLDKVVFKYGSPDVLAKVSGLSSYLLSSIENEVNAANIFGSDLSKPYTLAITVERATQGRSFTRGPYSYEIFVRYELKDGDNRVVYNRVLNSKSNIYKWTKSSAKKVNAKAVSEDIAGKFVRDLSDRLRGRQAEAVIESPLPLLIREAKIVTNPKRTNFGNYHALIIGNNRYQNLPALESAGFDARQLAEILKTDYGFETNLLLDATREQIVSALNEYRKQLSDDDNLLIYYAGHGWVDSDADEGYWLPVDAEQANLANWVSNASLTSTIRAMEAKHVLVIADSCYSGKLTRGATPQIRSPEYFTRMSSKRARTALTSGGLEPVLDSGGTDGHSVFASALFRALNENERIVDMSQLFSVIRRRVALDADQVPEYGDIRRAGHDGGDFVFVRRH